MNLKCYFSNDIFTDDAIRFLHHQNKSPFFLYLAYVTPHAEMLDPAEKNDLADNNPEIIQIMESIMKDSRTDNSYFPLKRSDENQELPVK